MLDWNDLRIFLAVARGGSALAAAKQLNLNQSTVSRRIAALEHALGMGLFLRSARGSPLSPQGAELLPHAEKVEAEAQALESEASRLRRGLKGVIRITSPEVIMAQFVGPLTLRFRQMHPEVRFDYVSAEYRLDLAKGDADVAFRAGGVLEGDTLVCVALPDILWSAYCAQSYRDSSGMPGDLAGLGQHPVIAFVSAVSKLPVAKAFMSQVPSQNIVGTSNSVANMCGMIRAGLGIGMLPCFLGDQHPGIVRCFDSPPEMFTPWWLMASPEAHQLLRVRAFMQFAAEAIRRDVAMLRGQAGKAAVPRPPEPSF